MGMAFTYVEARAGDCLIFGRTQAHLSDPRPIEPPPKRKTLVLRVLVKPTDEQGGLLSLLPRHMLISDPEERMEQFLRFHTAVAAQFSTNSEDSNATQKLMVRHRWDLLSSVGPQRVRV